MLALIRRRRAVGAIRDPRPAREPTLRHKRLVGVAALVAALLVVVVAYEKPNPFATHQTVRALFSDASGIGVVGADVRMAGTPVGQIVGVKRVDGGALLTMHLDPSAGRIARDATAELRPHLPFEGTAYVDLHPGSPSAPALAGATIPRAHTRVYVPLDEALRVLTPDTRTAVRRDAAALATVLHGQGRRGLRATLKAAPQLTRTLAGAALAAEGPHGTELAGAIAGLSRTVDGIAASQTELQPLLRSAARTLAALDTARGSALDATLARLPATLEATNAGGQALDGIVTRLDPLARALRPGLQALTPTLAQVRPLVRQARPALRSATPLLDDVRAALAAGGRATPAARAFLAELQPSLALLDSSLLPALQKPTAELHIPAYLSFINLFEGGGGASRPFQTASNGGPPDVMGLGHYMRFGARFFSGAGFPGPPCSLLAQANAQLAQQVSANGGCTP